MKRLSILKWTFPILSAIILSIPISAQKTRLERVHENVRTIPYPQGENTLYLNPSPLIVPVGMRKEEFLQFQLSQDKLFSKEPCNPPPCLGACSILTVFWKAVLGTGVFAPWIKHGKLQSGATPTTSP